MCDKIGDGMSSDPTICTILGKQLSMWMLLIAGVDVQTSSNYIWG